MFRYLLRRLRVLIPLAVASFMLVNYFSLPANAESAGEVSLSAVSCSNDNQGAVTVTLTAYSTGTDPVPFMLLIDNVSEGDNLMIPVTPGTPHPVLVSNLDDGTHRIEVIVNDQTVFDHTFEVTCDPAPTGPYTNPKGLLWDQCSGQVGVKISNYPIGNNFADLQPVTFTVEHVSNVYPGIKHLASVTLPAGEDDSFDSTFSVTPGSPGVVTLYADGVALQHLDYSGACVVVPDHAHHPKHKKHHHKHPSAGNALPNTGK